MNICPCQGCNCKKHQVATTGLKPVDLDQILNPSPCQIDCLITICRTAKPNSDPKLCLILSLKQALYVEHNIYDAIMPLVKHEATSWKKYSIIFITKHDLTSASGCKVATAHKTWSSLKRRCCCAHAVWTSFL